MNLNELYWDNRYQNNDDRWDLGNVSKPIKEYFDQLQNKSLKILIPGGGNSHEAEYAFKNGFTNIYVIDLSKTAIENFKKRVPEFPESQLLNKNFFELNDLFDLIIEQTFFCAIDPLLRPNYVKHTATLLQPKGKIVGLLFNAPLNNDKPPFGGNKEAYKSLFSTHYTINCMENCYNSENSRQGKELFIKLTKN